MSKIAIITDAQTAEFFTLTDFEIIESASPVDAMRHLQEMVKSDLEIIFIIKELASKIYSGIKKFQQGTGPVVVVIPGMATIFDGLTREAQKEK